MDLLPQEILREIVSYLGRNASIPLLYVSGNWREAILDHLEITSQRQMYCLLIQLKNPRMCDGCRKWKHCVRSFCSRVAYCPSCITGSEKRRCHYACSGFPEVAHSCRVGRQSSKQFRSQCAKEYTVKIFGPFFE